MKKASAGKHQEAIQALGELKSPEASFERAMLYKKAALDVVGGKSVDSLNAEKKNQYTALLAQAKDTLYLTYDRLRMPNVDKNHPTNKDLSQQLSQVEQYLRDFTTMDNGVICPDHESESFSDPCPSPPQNITNGHSLLPQMPLFSTPNRQDDTRLRRLEARPSPERLDAQIRHLTEVQENTLKHMEEQNCALRSQNQALRDTCSTMANEFKENAALYRSILEQNKSLSQDCYNSILCELSQIHNSVKDVYNQMKLMSDELSDIRAMKTSEKQVLPEPSETDVPTSDNQVPIDMTTREYKFDLT